MAAVAGDVEGVDAGVNVMAGSTATAGVEADGAAPAATMRAVQWKALRPSAGTVGTVGTPWMDCTVVTVGTRRVLSLAKAWTQRLPQLTTLVVQWRAHVQVVGTVALQPTATTCTVTQAAWRGVSLPWMWTPTRPWATGSWLLQSAGTPAAPRVCMPPLFCTTPWWACCWEAVAVAAAALGVWYWGWHWRWGKCRGWCWAAHHLC